MRLAFEKVAVVGLGYVGLPTAAILASHGVQVIGVDVDARAVDTINQGRAHIVEPALDAVLQAVVSSGKLHATATPQPADAFIIAVPTPLCGGQQPDISYIEQAARDIAPVLAKGNLVILESTSPVGTTRRVSQLLAEARPELTFPHQSQDPDIHVAHCPERVLPGRVLRELVENDRIIGGLSRQCANEARAFYRMFARGVCHMTDAETAEMAKLTENTFRDVNIALANELSIICEKHGINVWDMIELANHHPRVNILQPGPGVGGHCIAVDPWFIAASAPDDAKLIRTARQVNDAKPMQIVERVGELASRFRDPVIACLGLAYKADVDDLRESPALHIARELATREGLRVVAVEPYIDRLPDTLENIELMELDEAIVQADIVVLLVNHRFFLDFDREALSEKVVIDTRGVWR